MNNSKGHGRTISPPTVMVRRLACHLCVIGPAPATHDVRWCCQVAAPVRGVTACFGQMFARSMITMPFATPHSVHGAM
jgi:hypothetical protein